MNNNTHSIELTVEQWMELCYACGLAQIRFVEKDMEGTANKFDAIADEIVEGILNE